MEEFLTDLAYGWDVVIQWFDHLVQVVQNIPQNFWNNVWLNFGVYSAQVASWFPDTAADVSVLSTDSAFALDTFEQYVVVSNYFINLPALAVGLELIILSETLVFALSFVKLVWKLLPFG